MLNRTSEPAHGSFRSRALSILGFFFSFAAIGGCGAPGEPTPPAPQIPRPVTDLSAHQSGDGVQLRFTLPSKTIQAEPLAETPAVEILRGAVKADGSPDAKSFRVAQAVPGALVENYRADDQLQVTDAVPREELRNYPGSVLAYRVRTRVSRRRASAESNTAIVRLLPVAERITTLRATPTEAAIELAWTPPARTSEGEPLAAVSEYRIYKGEIDSSAAAAPKDLSQPKWKSPPTQIGRSAIPAYRDTDFRFGANYVYTVRSVTLADSHPVESSDSVPAVITPRDIYPPSVPQGLVAAVIVGDPTKHLEVDLSWSINPETDLAGYHVYRSEQQETRGELVTPELLLSPAYRDTSVPAAHRYWYSVTAVDLAGNESAPSAPVVAETTQPIS